MKFEIGDRVVGNGIVSRLDITGHVGTVVDCPDEFFTNYVVKFDERFSNNLWNNNGDILSTGNCWAMLPCHLIFADPDMIMEREKRRKELQLKYIDIDPYGEEVWDE